METYPANLVLSGWAAVAGFTTTPEGLTIAELRVLMRSPNKMTLNCIVDSQPLIEAVAELSAIQRVITQGILMQFTVHYLEFNSFALGSDMSNRVQLHGRLKAGNVWLIDGEQPLEEFPPKTAIPATANQSQTCNLLQKEL